MKKEFKDYGLSAELPDSILTKHQIKKFSKVVETEDDEFKMIVTVRYDDECGNRHNSFSITADIKTLNNRWLAGGCLHDEIKKYFPELSHLIKWHLCSSDGPMYYLANTLFFVSECESPKHKIGDPKRSEKFLKFGRFPKLFSYNKKGFEEWVVNQSIDTLEIDECIHPREPETFSPNYTLKGFSEGWYNCPFRSIQEAEEFIKCFKYAKPRIVSQITGTYKANSSFNIDFGRSSAIWADAKLEDLQDPKKLVKRLPALMEEFRQTIEDLNFIY